MVRAGPSMAWLFYRAVRLIQYRIKKEIEGPFEVCKCIGRLHGREIALARRPDSITTKREGQPGFLLFTLHSPDQRGKVLKQAMAAAAESV